MVAELLIKIDTTPIFYYDDDFIIIIKSSTIKQQFSLHTIKSSDDTNLHGGRSVRYLYIQHAYYTTDEPC